MSAPPVVAQIQVRYGTAAEWAEANPVLAQGEPGLDTTHRIFRLGDGVTAWLSLPVIAGSGSPGADGAPGINGVDGMTNPMSAAGDLIVGGTAGAAENLAHGDEGDVLTVASGAPAWAAPTGGTPANMVTTDTTQLVTGTKTLSGPLYFGGAAGAAAVNGSGPQIVASFAAKGLMTGLSTILLASAPAGQYVGYFFASGEKSDPTQLYCNLYGGANNFHPDTENRGWTPLSFIHESGDVVVEFGYPGDTPDPETTGTNVVITLERLPDAPGAAALYYLNATAATDVDAGATVTPTPTGPTHASGTSVSVLATASSGYHFVEWTGDDTSTDNPLTLTMDAAKSVTATFAED